MNKLLIFLIPFVVIANTITGQKIIKGAVVDETNNNPIKNAKVILLGNSGAEYSLYSDYMGLFKFETDTLDKSTEFILTAIKTGYLTGRKKVLTPFPSEPVMICLTSFVHVDYFSIVTFTYNSDIISKKDSIDISILSEITKINSNIIVEIGGFQESSEQDSISYYRAEKIKNILIKTGVDQKQLEIKDYRADFPFVLRKKEACSLGLDAGTKLSEKVISSIKIDKKRDEASRLNRRVEFKVISKNKK